VVLKTIKTPAELGLPFVAGKTDAARHAALAARRSASAPQPSAETDADDD